MVTSILTVQLYPLLLLDLGATQSFDTDIRTRTNLYFLLSKKVVRV